MKTLLIANNPAVQPTAGNYDLYVDFNHAMYWDLVPADKSIVCSRERPPVQKAQSFTALYRVDGLYGKHIPDEQIWPMGWEKIVRAIQPKGPIIALDPVPYPKGQSPTTGYAALHHFMTAGYEVYLCGFDLKNSTFYHTTRLHAPDFEIEEIDRLEKAGMIFRG